MDRTISRGRNARWAVTARDANVRILQRICTSRGSPRSIKVDNGSEFISKAMDRWAYENRVELDFSRPGKPTDNARIESFNGRLRRECLTANWFLSLADARRKVEEWRRYYNEGRPHSALGWVTRAEFAPSLRAHARNDGFRGTGNLWF
ncbi:hypothetical protein BN2476_940035 [Paraburkholderia piptadeniae]|uniref:Integrase catalytic domain-containing protein n=1 Tax=Paraburkholderia piptadeniae TaxID=1701573 RepID=A0A1N7STT6_9BURK|nr:hypothetical protein BN2476_940035 [Paraburkholderia piptadeniae]